MISSAAYRLRAMPTPFAPARILAQDLDRFWGGRSGWLASTWTWYVPATTRTPLDDHGDVERTVDEFLEWVEPGQRAFEAAQHQIGNVLIEVSGDTAWSESYFMASHKATSDTPGTVSVMTMFGRYVDRFERPRRWIMEDRQARRAG